MHAAEATARRSTIHPVTLRWLALIDQHGSQSAALVALFRQVDRLERLERAVRGCGLSPEILASETHGGTLAESQTEDVR